MDNAATTALDPKVTQAMLPFFEQKYGNASSSHQLGRQAKEALERSRSVIAKSIGAKAGEIFFTSGGTEANNFAIKSVAFANRSKGNHIITTKVEHECVLNSCKWLEKQGFKATYLDVDKEGFVNPEEIEKAITPKTILVSVIHGNNEIGTIQDLAAIGKVCRKHSVLLHTDACQSYCKTDLDVNKQQVDLVTLNAHKIHGPKGVGALYIREGVNILAWQSGGGHEGGLRSGTENIPGIVGFAECVKQGASKTHRKHMTALRDKLIYGVLKIEGARLNGPRGDKRLCNNANFVFPGLVGETIGGYLDQKGICSSTASACTVHTNEPSHVLQAIGLSKEEAEGGLRLTISRFTTEEEVDKALKALPGIIAKIR
ncbi:cysteine desulfurase [Candidatus Woesearchaeota archaeon]|nr:cysteine desulfurase [Candidatus Woesearchaeota archaeon]